MKAIRSILAVLALSAVAFAAHSASLTCTDSPDKATNPTLAYNFYRGTTSGGPYTILNTTPVATCAFTDTTIVVGQKYFWVTTAVLNGNESVNSNEATGVVLPSPPSVLKVVVQ